MKKFSTRYMKASGKKTIAPDTLERSTPSKQTLDFLTQFARVYYSEQQVPAGLNGFLIN